MTLTANLALPFIEAAQAQKHVTHNEALRILDAAIQIAVQDINRTAPPSSPAEGQRHIVAASPTGAWAGRAKAIASWQDGAWAFAMPKTGWCAWSIADSSILVYDSGAWRDTRGLGLDNLLHLGINAIASSPNLLCVKSNAALFAAINSADGGSGDVRVQLSKESAAKTASVLFSDAFSGRAEFGLVGSDAFKLKVSSDGSGWIEAFAIDQTSGNLSLPRGVSLTGVIAPAQITANQNDYAPSGFVAASVVQISSDAARSVTGLAGGAEGRVIALVNVGSQPVTFADDSASSAAANRFAFGGAVTLGAKRTMVLRYDGTAARWHALARPAPVTRGAISGLTLSTAGSSTTFSIAAGAAADSTAIDTLTLASPISKTVSAWSAGSGNGALDIGSIAASTWYHVHLIKRCDTNAVDALVSLSATAPTLPANYTLARRIGAMKTDASSTWTAFVQDGNRFVWAVAAADFAAASNPGTAAILRALSVPPGVNVFANFHARSVSSTVGSAVATIFSDPAQPDTAPDFNVAQQIGNTTLSPFTSLSIRTDTSRQIRVRLNFSDSNVGFYLITDGWTDPRGS